MNKGFFSNARVIFSFRLANHEVKEEEQVMREDPAMTRPAMWEVHTDFFIHVQCIKQDAKYSCSRTVTRTLSWIQNNNNIMSLYWKGE